jgi:hypothetical protein
MNIGSSELDKALRLLGGHLRLQDAPPMKLVVCGGAALLARGLQTRTTQDVDILAFMDAEKNLVAPVPLPENLLEAADRAAKTLGLPENWLNNEPSARDNGLFQGGLPEGIEHRMICREYGDHLRVFFVGRLDQIHFKLLAAANVGGRHLDDLLALAPTADELEQAARWAVARNADPVFLQTLTGLLGYLGYGNIAERL